MMIALSDALDRTVVMWGTQSKITSFGGLDRLRETLVETLQGLAGFCDVKTRSPTTESRSTD